MPENVGELLETNQTASASPQPVAVPGEGAISALKFFAWLDLIGGIIGSIWVWAELGTRRVPGYYSLTETTPLGIVIGFAVLLQGMFVCALFLVIASIAESLIVIRKNMASK